MSSLVVLGLGIRLKLAFSLPIWLDEDFTVRHLQSSLATILSGQLDPTHPFGYYVFLKLWSLVSPTLIWLRMSSVLLYLVNCGLLYAITAEQKKPLLSALVLFFYAFSGYFLIFDWQARMYTGVLSLMLLSWYLLRRKAYGWFGLVTAAGLLFDYAFIWYALCVSLWVGWRYFTHVEKSLRELVAIALAWVPFGLWLPHLLEMYTAGVGGIEWAVLYATPGFFIPFFLGTHNQWWLTSLFLALGVAGWYWGLLKENNTPWSFWTTSGLVAVVLALVLSVVTDSSIFHVRNLQLAGLAIILALASGCEWLWQKKWILGLIGVGILVVVNSWLVYRLHQTLPGTLLLSFSRL